MTEGGGLTSSVGRKYGVINESLASLTATLHLSVYLCKIGTVLQPHRLY